MLPEDILTIIDKLQKRVSALESGNQNQNIKIVTGGKIVVNTETADPPVENGKIYYNSTSKKYRICEDGVWKDMSSAASGVPTGTIVPFAGSTVPTGWLLCDGSSYSRSGYSALYGVIGTAYGVGDGSTTFNIPNLKGKVPVGYNSSETEFNTLGKTGGEKSHVLTVSEMPSHSHTFGSTQNGGNATVITGINGSYTNLPNYDYLGVNQGIAGGTDGRIYIKNNGGGGSHNNLQPYLTINYLIKI